jgi:hypothetical protein
VSGRPGRARAALGVLWQLPLSAASWLFFHLTRFLLGRLYTWSLSKMTVEAHEWNVLSERNLARPLVLPIVATKGPRWNTHAVIVTAGPVEVRRSLSLRVAGARDSAASWSIVVYANPGFETIASVESDAVPAAAEWQEVALEPGRYSLNLRYYEPTAAAAAPAVLADGVPVIQPLPVPADSNDFYATLAERRRHWFYAAIHYYVFHMLRFRRGLPEAFVRREFLPVGDPATVFRFGHLWAGERVAIETAPELLAAYRLYLTLYDRSSFPVASLIVDRSPWQAPAAAQDGYYLLRLRRRAGVGAEIGEGSLAVRTAGAAADGPAGRAAAC